MKTKRAFLVEPGRFELREAEVEVRPTDLLVKVAVCGLCNWELNHWLGLLGQCPQTLGHEWAGEVVAMGDEVEGFSVGDRVTCLADSLTGFSEYAVTPYTSAFKLAPGTDVRFALGEPLKCIVTVLHATMPAAGDYGVVVGCGPMGLWCLQGLGHSSLAGSIAVDTDNEKLAMAKKYGATHLINPAEEDAEARIREITNGHMADFVIEGTGVPEVLEQCIHYLRANVRGRLVLMSSYERAANTFDFRPAVDRSIELRVAHPGYSRDQTDDLRRAVDLWNQNTFDLSEMISHRFTLEDIQTAFETLERKPNGYIKGAVYPHGEEFV